MMEKLGEPQTHLALKEMIKTVDEDNDGQISFREVRTYMHACKCRQGGTFGAESMHAVANLTGSGLFIYTRKCVVDNYFPFWPE